MTLTPVEIRHIKPAKSLFGGYERDAIDALLNEIAASFEDVWRERADLADKVEQLEGDLTRFRELEGRRGVGLSWRDWVELVVELAEWEVRLGSADEPGLQEALRTLQSSVREDFGKFVCNDDDGLPLFAQTAKYCEHLGDFLRGEHRGRFVEDQDSSAPVKRLQDLDALLLAD